MTATHQPPMPPPAPPTSAMPPPVAPPAPPAKKKRWPWVVGALVVLTVIGAAMGGGDKDAKDSAAPVEDAPAVEDEVPTEAVAPEDAAAPVADETPTDEPVDSGISQGFGSKDASADVTEVQIIRDDDEFLPIDEVSVKVTNNSEKRSDYFIDVAVESADGSTKIDSTTIYVENLEPGQSTVQTGMLTEDLPDDAVPSVKSIQRTASN